MSSREAVRILEASGFSLLRRGRGSHVILQRGLLRIVIPHGRQELSVGMAKKVLSLSRKEPA